MSDESEDGLSGETVRRRHVLLKAILVGLLAGAVGSAFRLALDRAEALRTALVTGLPRPAALVVAVVAGACGAALASWLVSRFAPHASGSGIPQLRAVLLRESEPEWRRLLPVKFASGLSAIGSGLALGREGPTIQMGGAVGAMLAQLLRVRAGEGERRALISAGAGAGLAAAFNAPLSGLVFVLEELHGRFTPALFVAAFLASLIADVVSRLLVGELPVFAVPSAAPPGVSSIPAAAILGVLAGLAGMAFNRSLLGALDLRERLGVPLSWLAAVVGALAGLVAWWQPAVAGSGGALVRDVLAGRTAVGILLLLLAVRFALTILSYATGAAGGIFAPLLLLGAVGGLWCASSPAHGLLPAGVAPQAWCVLGMGALFAAVVRAPLTGIVLMIELTGQYGFMLPLLVSCLLAYGVAEAAGNAPIYEALRRRAARPSER
jgi:CIC family chloride channel protein